MHMPAWHVCVTQVLTPQSLSLRQPTQLPTPSHSRPVPHGAPEGADAWLGTPPEQPVVTQGLVLVGKLLSSAMLIVPPKPLHTSFWQLPATWPAGLPVPAGVSVPVHMPPRQVWVAHASFTPQ